MVTNETRTTTTLEVSNDTGNTIIVEVENSKNFDDKVFVPPEQAIDFAKSMSYHEINEADRAYLDHYNARGTDYDSIIKVANDGNIIETTLRLEIAISAQLAFFKIK